MKKLCSLILAAALCAGLAAPAAASSASFSDVSETHWAHSFVQEMVEQGVMNGVGNGQFNPDGQLSGVEFAAMLARAFWPEELEAQTAQAPAGSPWWWGAAAAIYAKGGFNGTPIAVDYARGGTLAAAPLNRYDMAGMVYALLQGKGLPVGTDKDAEINKSYLSDWSSVPAQYGDAVSRVMAVGILTGKSGNNFAGMDTMTRAEAAAVMSRLLALRAANPNANGTGLTPETPPAAPAEPEPTDPVTPPATDHNSPEAIQAARLAILDLVNAERAKEGLKPLTLNQTLCDAAQVRAEELQKVFDHTRPDGTPCYTVLDGTGISFHMAAENIAAGQPTPEWAMKDWMNSPGHRANILHASAKELGVGVFWADDGYQFYWSQLFIG